MHSNAKQMFDNLYGLILRDDRFLFLLFFAHITELNLHRELFLEWLVDLIDWAKRMAYSLHMV